MCINALATHFNFIAMKNLLLFLMVLGVMGSCQRKQDLLPENYPNLLITRISFSGIPDKDVSIDQLNRIIYVKMPALATVTQLTPTIELSEDAKLEGPYIEMASIYRWCCPDKDYLKINLRSKTRSHQYATYTIKPIAIGSLSITQSTPLAVFARGDSAYIHIETRNTYGNGLPKAAIFTNKKTGKQFVTEKNRVLLFYRNGPNKITIDAYSTLSEIGEYDIELQWEDGKLLKVPQPLTVIRGTSRFYYTFYGVAAQSGTTLNLVGYNLYQEGVSFRLHYPNGTTIPLTSTFVPEENKVSLDIPVSLSPGGYSFEMIKNGVPQGENNRVNIVRYVGQPYINSIGNSEPRKYPTTDPLILPREKSITVTFPVIQKLERYFLTLINESDATSTFRFSFTLPDEASPFCIIPANVPAGRYKAYIQEYDAAMKEVVQQSEPFERIVVLQ